MDRMVDDAMKLINLASKLKEGGGLEELLNNEIDNNDLEDILMEEDEDEEKEMEKRMNFYKRYDEVAEKLKEKKIMDKWNELKKEAVLKK